MRTTITVADALLADAREVSGIEDVAALVRHALQTYVQREAAQLARLDGSEPGLEAAPRRRYPPATDDEAGINERPPIWPRKS